MLERTKQYNQLLNLSLASLKQKPKYLDTVIKPRIAYAYYAVPFSKPGIKNLNKVIIKLTK